MKQQSKKKYRLKKKTRRVVIPILTFLLLIVGWLVFSYGSRVISMTSMNYSVSFSLKAALHPSFMTYVTSKPYSKTLEIMYQSADYEEQKKEQYAEIESFNVKEFPQQVARLLRTGYTTGQINLIFEKDIVDPLLERYVQDIDQYLEVPYFKVRWLDRYLKAFTGDYEDTVLLVNMNRDSGSEIIQIEENFKVNRELLVNGRHELGASFVPQDLVPISDCATSGYYLDKEAEEHYVQMCRDLRKEGIPILANSAYRSYQDQQGVYQNYLKTYGQAYVDRYVAVPGFSEHQTGLAIDIKEDGISTFANSRAFVWLKEHAAQYGFLLRYPKEAESLTGVSYEPWHYRYVGVDLAKKVKESGLIYDQYYAMYLLP